MIESHVEYRIARQQWPGSWTGASRPVRYGGLQALKNIMDQMRRDNPEIKYRIESRTVDVHPWDGIPGS